MLTFLVIFPFDLVSGIIKTAGEKPPNIVTGGEVENDAHFEITCVHSDILSGKIGFATSNNIVPEPLSQISYIEP